MARSRPTLEAVFREHHDYVWRSLRRLGLGEDQVDDAVQDVFLVVHERLDEFEFRASLRTWLFRICMNVAMSHQRRSQRDNQAELLIPQGSLTEKLERREALRLLDALLDSLDTEQRAVYVLAEIEGHSGPEIARMLGIELNTAYSRLRLARAKMARALRRLACKSV
ncbi:RNA polymerase, sigma-24 subunit, ECF subfamily protein [Plesiocystis pacifica SIR-1]|uniref:RNA polymerase, sigma-24 subunit, ECF subfamily protein n=1 Tax=Plesiocystis pacifica SIR-1 TaxID=391625 RepID=A6GJ86_9BACT|nr:RNA polymerase sigma factor [Plesiocystis pacifica]EDM74062.1 RNA polymerase, sigma-24 subunit, ECF subfamily protein [Plesiocystis pacifica SIR-1]